MTKVTFENATIRDVIGKASRVAPTKGTAFDKTAGILMEVDPDNSEVIVRATNTEIYYMEITDVVEIDGAARTWRIPSVVLDGICNKLPITSGKTVTFDDKDSSELTIKQARMVARIRLMDPTYFPKWEAFDPTDLASVSDFGGRLEQVQWAASKEGLPPITGINLDGEYAMATDRFRIAIAPCEIPQLAEPVTIPSNIFAPLMKSLGEVKIGQEQGYLLLMPDDNTQIRTVIFDGQYPRLTSIIKRDEPAGIFMKKSYLIDVIQRAMVMGQRDRTPILKCIIGLEEFAVMMEEQELGLLGDVIELPGQCTHDRATLCFTPTNLTSALEASPNEDVTFYYNPEMPNKPVRLDGGSGYEVIIMPRKERDPNQ